MKQLGPFVAIVVDNLSPRACYWVSGTRTSGYGHDDDIFAPVREVSTLSINTPAHFLNAQ